MPRSNASSVLKIEGLVFLFCVIMSAQTVETNISVNNTNVCLKVNSAYLSEEACSNLYDQLRNREDFLSDGALSDLIRTMKLVYK